MVHMHTPVHVYRRTMLEVLSECWKLAMPLKMQREQWKYMEINGGISISSSRPIQTVCFIDC